MSLVANQQGEIHARFTVPSGIPVGTVSVQAITELTTGKGKYTANGIVSTELRRKTLTSTITRVDPLAQTFSLANSHHVAGCDLWFKMVGQKSVMVEIRETTAGLPNSTVLARTRVAATALNTTSSTRIVWEPIWLEAGQEYALVILTDDDQHAVAVAEIGKKDPVRGFILAQPYQVGVLLSSANASTWTPHQSADLTFRLLAAQFEQTHQTETLDTLDLTGYTDLLLLANVERTTSQTDVVWQVGEQKLQEGTPLALAKALVGHQTLSVTKAGATNASPVIYPSVQLAAGKIRASGTYVTRAIPVGDEARITGRFEALLPGQASVQVEFEINGVYQVIPLNHSEALGDGWFEHSYVLDGISTPTTRVRLALHGSAADRPKLKNLRVITNDN